MLQSIEALELRLCRGLNRHLVRPGVRLLFVSVSRLGDGPLWYAVILAMPLLTATPAAVQMAATGLAATGLTTLAALAMNDEVPRNVDVTVLWLAGALTIGMVATWVFLPRLPKWIVSGWGLILIALGIGVIITAPVPAGAGQFPWALVGLVVFGIVIVITALVHSGARSDF